MSLAERQNHDFYALGRIASRALRGHQKTTDAIVSENLRGCREPAVRIEHDARGMRPGNSPYCELRIVGEHGPDTDNDGIDQRS